MGVKWSTTSGVLCEIDALDYREAWNLDGNSTTANFTIPWAQRGTFRKDMLGYVKPGARGSGMLMRFPPQLCGGTHNQPQYCLSANLIEAYGSHSDGGVSNWLNYDSPDGRAKYQCVFQWVPYKPYLTDDQVTLERQRYVWRKRRILSREQKVPGGGFRFADTSTPLAEVGFRISTEIEYTYTWYRVPLRCLPGTAILTTIGAVNDADFGDGNGNTYLTGTLLLNSVDDSKQYCDPAGELVADVVFVCRFKLAVDGSNNPVANSWNMLPDREGTLRAITSVPNGKPLYRGMPFANLFTPVNP